MAATVIVTVEIVTVNVTVIPDGKETKAVTGSENNVQEENGSEETPSGTEETGRQPD